MAGAVHNHPQDGLNLNPTITAEVAMEMLSQARVREVQLEAAVRQLLQQNEQAANNQLQLIERINELEAELNPEMHSGPIWSVPSPAVVLAAPLGSGCA